MNYHKVEQAHPTQNLHQILQDILQMLCLLSQYRCGEELFMNFRFSFLSVSY
jgi:hypothetical protein